MVKRVCSARARTLDSGRGIFFRSADAFADYANATAKKENVTPKEANEGYAGALRAIRSANDRIADAVLIEKIAHLRDRRGQNFPRGRGASRKAAAGRDVPQLLPAHDAQAA